MTCHAFTGCRRTFALITQLNQKCMKTFLSLACSVCASFTVRVGSGSIMTTQASPTSTSLLSYPVHPRRATCSSTQTLPSSGHSNQRSVHDDSHDSSMQAVCAVTPCCRLPLHHKGPRRNRHQQQLAAQFTCLHPLLLGRPATKSCVLWPQTPAGLGVAVTL